MKELKLYEPLEIAIVKMAEISVLTASPSDNDGEWLWGGDKL